MQCGPVRFEGRVAIAASRFPASVRPSGRFVLVRPSHLSPPPGSSLFLSRFSLPCALCAPLCVVRHLVFFFRLLPSPCTVRCAVHFECARLAALPPLGRPHECIHANALPPSVLSCNVFAYVHALVRFLFGVGSWPNSSINGTSPASRGRPLSIRYASR